MMLWMRYHGLEGKNLETIVKFCISAYFKLFFEIKVQHHIKYAPQHILSALKLLKDQTPQVRAIITPELLKKVHIMPILRAFYCHYFPVNLETINPLMWRRLYN